MNDKMKKWKIVIFVLISLVLISFVTSKFIELKFADKKFSTQIAIIPIKGAISIEGGGNLIIGSAGTSSGKVVGYLEKANKDNNIKGIILEINSPGGTVVASEEIVNAVKKIDKPVVAWIREVGASGAYWIASASDEIVASPMSITGSIGVIGSYLEFEGLMEKYGVGYERLIAGQYKDMGSPYRSLEKNEKALLQSKLNSIYFYLVSDIAKNRNLKEEKVRQLANGFFYLGQEAYENGLVDHLGGKDLALNITKKLANLDKVSITEFKEKEKWYNFLTKISAFSSYHLGQGIGSSLYLNLKDNRLSIDLE